MDQVQAQQVVNEANAWLQAKPWIYLELMSYQGSTLVVMGGIDFSAAHEVEIHFEDVFCISTPVSWDSDTASPPLQLLTGEEMVAVNRHFKVEQGHHVFRFTADDYPENFGCIICARAIQFKVIDTA